MNLESFRLRRFIWKMKWDDCFGYSNAAAIVLQRLFFRRQPLVVREWKRKWYLACDRRRDDQAALREVLVREEYHPWIRRSLRDGACSYVNVGGHVGSFDVAVAELAGRVPRALTVELNPLTYLRLRVNLDLNALDHVRALHAGIAGEARTLRFRAGDYSSSDGVYNPGNVADEGVDVRLLTLEQALDEAGMGGESEFDLLKLDGEGAEYEIVRTIPAAVLRRFRHLVLEIHAPPPGESKEALFRRLAECGFTMAPPDAALPPDAVAVLHFWTRDAA